MDKISSATTPVAHPAWMKAIKVFETPNLRRALLQIIDTLLPFVAVWGLAVWSLAAGLPYPVTLLLMVPGSLLMVRMFIFFHDCTHGSFFKSQHLNAFWGTIFGIITFTPFDDWRRQHGIHHNTHGNLDRRGVGDVWTLTLEEFKQAKPSTRFWYRLYRNPIVLFLIIPPLLFLILQRLPRFKASFRENLSIQIANLGVAALAVGLIWLFGLPAFLLVHLPMFYLASVLGVWLFYVQHQFDPGYWERNSEWENLEASIQGSSHYKLPKILQWFTGNIGLHHIHHARPRIPNYNLQACYDKTPELQLKDPLTLWASFRSLNMHLWDEANKRLLSFRQARRRLFQTRVGSAG